MLLHPHQVFLKILVWNLTNLYVLLAVVDQHGLGFVAVVVVIVVVGLEGLGAGTPPSCSAILTKLRLFCRYLYVYTIALFVSYLILSLFSVLVTYIYYLAYCYSWFVIFYYCFAFFALILYLVPDVINNFRNLSYLKFQLVPDAFILSLCCVISTCPGQES